MRVVIRTENGEHSLDFYMEYEPQKGDYICVADLIEEEIEEMAGVVGDEKILQHYEKCKAHYQKHDYWEVVRRVHNRWETIDIVIEVEPVP